MIFNEIYSAYYNTVAKIISSILKGDGDEKSLSRIVCENAFGESILSVLPALKSQKWQLIKADGSTPIKQIPTMPLTLVQKQWLKAISLDPRMSLFGITLNGLEETDPLFTAEDYLIYDQYSDGDPYEDKQYQKHFQTILYALKHEKNLKIEMINRKGRLVYSRCVPKRLEYSEKDDKFRLVTCGCPFIRTINIARITKCKLYNGDTEISSPEPERKTETLTLKISDKRNTLERCMLHFAHFEKRAEKVKDHYLLHLCFSQDDERELVIRVLSFGPTVEVVAPEAFRTKMIEKLKSQKSCELL
ncbi:MAG: WYL domain-containing protein [Clostridia bacterium]|nr:WYL domain-containing protein [Clostridia bacterium]